MKTNHWLILGCLSVLFFSGCAVMRTGGYWESPPLNRIEGHATIIPPPVFQNLYDIMHKPTRDPAGLGYVQYNPIGKPECRLGRRVRIEIRGYSSRELSCDLGNVFTEYYIPVRETMPIKLEYLTVDGKVIHRKVIPLEPDLYMRKDRYSGSYGWYITIGENFWVNYYR
ncbi:hypothetical protein EPN15_01310 [Patescibacteria group bacterium]|nr:MAG: hypothetical protein EPN15_01310 [Patescibacteria group bacterium]